jgi:acetaldehyde dehydrogenase/alcohol dehydrogenase
MPMLEDMKVMMEAAYYGITFEAVKERRVHELPAATKASTATAKPKKAKA